MSRSASRGLHLHSRSRVGGVAVLLAAVLLLFAGNAQAKHSRSSLVDTVWTGDITVVDVEGNTSVLTASSLTFETESGDLKFLSGTLSAPEVAFSAIRSGDELRLGAADYVIAADIDRHEGHHSRGSNSATLKIHGRSVADGSSFIGTLTKQ
jgi:hypothetical protein